MPKLRFERFDLGELTKPGETDVPLGGATRAKNVNFSSQGQLLSQKGFLLNAAGPTGVVLESAIRYEWNLPSPFGRKKTWIVHGKDGGGRDEIWWKPYWNPETEAWVDAWQELTEVEGLYTMEAGTTTTKVRDVTPFHTLQSSSNYYKTFVLVNLTRQKSMIIDTSTADATNRDLNLKHAITSQASGDKYLIFRFALFMPVEGLYTMDVGTTTAIVIDTQLLSDTDDLYNVWTIRNTTRSLEVSITDHISHENKLTHPTIASQTSGDSYYLYEPANDIRLGGEKVRFFQRFNAVEISLGNDQRFPLKAPLIFQFIKKQWHFESANEFEGFLLSRNVLIKPDTSQFKLTDAGTTEALAGAIWYFKISFIYDGYQEGPLSDIRTIDNTAFGNPNTEILFEFDTSYAFSDISNKPSSLDAIFNKRITHFKIYAAKGSHGDAIDDYFNWAIFPISSLFFKKQQIWANTSNLYDTSATITLTDKIWNGTEFKTLFNDSVVIGRTLRWDAAQGHRSETIHCNYKFRSVLQEQVFKAPVFTDEKRDAAVNFSVQSNSNGVPADDVIPIQNIIDFAFKGVTEITGLASIGGSLIIFTPNRIFIYEPDILLGEFPIERGSIAPDSIVEVGDSVFFAATDDIYEFNRSGLTKLMFGKNVDQWEALTQTNKEDTVAGYVKKTNSLWFLAGGTIFIYDLDYQAWRRHTTSITPVYFAADKDQTLFAITSSEIYELESDSFTETIDIDWESTVVNYSKGSNGIPARGNVKSVELDFSGDRQVEILIYDVKKSATVPLRTLKFFSSVPRRVSIPVDKLKVGIKTTGGGSSQPTTEIDSLLLDVDLVTKNG